jgi:site-specific DNA recombinase
MRKVGIYVRVSTEEQARVEEGSIKNQVETLTKYVEAENLKDGKWGALVDVYRDEGYSAKSLNRPELKRLLLDISKKRIDTVVIVEISRLSRLVKDWIDLRSFFHDHGAAFIATRQRFDTSTAMGRAMLDFAIQFAQLEREMTVERVKASYYSRASRGLWPGGPVPYGLDTTDKPGNLQVNSAKQIIAEEIFDILTEKAGYITKAVQLIREAGYARDGGVAWDDSSLCRWVRNRALIGEIELNEKNRGREETNLPESERYKVVPAVWGAVVDRKKWERANALLDRNYKMLKVPQWKHNEFLLTGMIRCPEGKLLTGASGHGRSGDKYPYYRHQRKCGCHFSSLKADEIERVVLRKLKEVASSEENAEQLVAKANEDFKKARPNHREASLAARRKIEGFAAQLDQVTNEILRAASPSERRIWIEKSHRLLAEKERAEVELQMLEKDRHGTDAGMMNADEVKTALARFLSEFDTLPLAARRGLVTSLIDSVEVHKDEIVLNLKNPGFRWQKKAPVQALLGCESGDQNLDERSKWGDRRGSNPRHLESQSNALPTELRPPQECGH